jgi:hypothetical protein
VVKPTIPSVMMPPKITEGISPISLAATPDSNDPISLEDPMKMAPGGEIKDFHIPPTFRISLLTLPGTYLACPHS